MNDLNFGAVSLLNTTAEPEAMASCDKLCQVQGHSRSDGEGRSGPDISLRGSRAAKKALLYGYQGYRVLQDVV
jgi:hypothetical protein